MSGMSRRSFLAKSALTAGAVVGAGALLEACGSNNAGNTTLTVMYTTNEIPDKYNKMFEAQNAGVKINFLQYDATHLNALLAAGTPPDVLRISGATDIPYYAGRGLLADLTNNFNKSTVLSPDKLTAINGVYQWNGKVQGQGPRYGIDKDWSIDTQIWYNKKLFDAAGVAQPSETTPMSYDELLDLARRLTKSNDGKVSVYGLMNGWEFGFTYPQLVGVLSQTSTSLFNDDLTKADFTQAEVKKFLQWYVDWAKLHAGTSPIENVPGGYGQFTGETAAMLQFGYWYDGSAIVGATNGIQDHIGLLPSPQWGSKYTTYCFTATGAVIPAQSKNKDLAFKYLEFFAGGQMGIDRAKAGNGLTPLTSSLALLPQTPAFQQQAYTSVQSQLKFFTTLTFSPYATSAGVQTAIDKFLTPVMQGSGTVDQAAGQITDAVNLLLSTGKNQVG